MNDTLISRWPLELAEQRHECDRHVGISIVFICLVVVTNRL